jgi:hypothetical protein
MNLNMGSLSQYLPQGQSDQWGGSMQYGGSPQMPQVGMPGAPTPGVMGQLDTSNVMAGFAPPSGLSAMGSQFSTPALPGSVAAPGGASFMDGLTGYTKTDGTKVNGWGGLALGAASGIANTFMGMKQYGMAKDALKENKRQFNLNYGAQRDTANTRMEDRQRARVADSPGHAQSVDSYMEKNRIK